MNKRRIMSATGAVALIALALQACSQADPDPNDGGGGAVEWKQITYVTPYAPGGSTDAVARAFAPMLASKLGTSAVVVNRPGGDEVVGLTSVVNARPDGHTLGLSTPVGVAVQPLVVPGLPFASPDQYTGVALMAEAPFALLVDASSPWKTLDDFVAAAKADPGQLDVASTGRRTLNSYVIAALEQSAGIDVNLVPFESAAEAQTATLGKKTDAFVAVATAQVGLVTAGKLRALAVTGDEAYQKLPEATTFKAAGYEVPFTSAYLTVAAAGIPADVVASLENGVKATLASSEWLDWCAKQGFTPKALTGSAVGDWVRAQQAALKPIINLVDE